MDPVDGYHRNERAVKYAMMFIMLNLLIFLLWERSLGQGAIHPVQYVVIGLALALFYLVLLTLSEHLGFGWAYLAASVLDVIMVGGYSLAVTRKPRGAAVVGGLLALLHGVLYVILSLEDYALLAGTTLLIVAMTAVMISTRRLADPAAPSPGPPAGGPVEGLPRESSPDNPSPESLSIESQSQESRPSEAASPGEGSEPAV
jgi:inner membrane protein